MIDFYLLTVYILHILIITPIMIEVGFSNHKSSKKQMLGIMGLTGLIYHSVALLITVIIGRWTWNWSDFF